MRVLDSVTDDGQVAVRTEQYEAYYGKGDTVTVVYDRS